MKKILFFSSSFPYGFSEGFINAEIEGLEACGAEITVLPTYPKGSLNTGNVKVKTIYLPLFRLTYIFSLLRLFISSPRKFSSLLALNFDGNFVNSLKNLAVFPKLCHFFITSKEEYDFAFAYWASIPAQFAMLYSSLTGCPWGLSGHRWDIVEKNNFEKKFSRAAFVRLISESGVEILGADLSARFAEKIRIVHLGVDTSSQSNVTASLASQKIVCIANLIPVKGIEYLLEAMTLVADKISLDIIGRGPSRKLLAEKATALGIKDRVNFLGALPHSQVTGRLLSGNYGALVLPSVDLGGGLHEGIPAALMEAMASGVPVISTRTGGIPELIGENSEFGICVDDKSPEQLATAINSLFGSQALRAQYGVQGRERVLEDFDSKKISRVLFEMMEKVAVVR